MKLQKNVPLSRHSSYLIGGDAKYFLKVQRPGDLKYATQTAKKLNVPLFVLGGGTNILFSDAGYDGLVIQLASSTVEVKDGVLHAGAGAPIKKILDTTTQRGLSGLEWAGGLPGTIGGAIRGNAGAFKGEIKDSVKYVESYNPKTGKMIRRSGVACKFGYRNSIFKNEAKNEIIWKIGLKLKPGDKKEIKEKINEKVSYRETKHPMEHPNIGSIFKNVPVRKAPLPMRAKFRMVVKKDPIPVIPTAALVAAAHLQGISFGGAMISPKHTNFIVNVCVASANEVRTLIQLAKAEVWRKFKVRLEEEIMVV